MATQDQINHETDLRFWAAHPEKANQKLAANDPLVAVWLAFNTVVKQDAANGAWSPDGQVAATSPDEIQMPDDYVGQPPGGVTSPSQVADAGGSPPGSPMDPLKQIPWGQAPDGAGALATGTAPLVTLPRPKADGVATKPKPSVGTGKPAGIMTAQHPYAHPAAASPSAPSIRPDIDPATQKQLYAETNARFWAQTGYRPGQKLDVKKPADAAMLPVWNNIYAKVESDYRNGVLVLTHTDPNVADATAAAQDHHANAADHVASAHQAAAAGDDATAGIHLAAAKDEHDKGQQATQHAASYQPPTISPELVHHAHHQIQDFQMNGAGFGVAGAIHQDPGDVIATMQIAAAPANADAVAAAASSPAQVAPDTAALPTFANTPDEKVHKKSTPSNGKLALGIGLAAVAAVGFGAFAYTQGEHRRGR